MSRAAADPPAETATEASARRCHRLDGLEPDNLLAVLALLGLLRAIEADDRTAAAPLRPRAAWDLDEPPLRPVLHVCPEQPPRHRPDQRVERLQRLP